MIKKISAGDQGVPDGEGAEMSFFDHLEELRWHIVKSIIAILIFAVVVYIFESWVFENIIFAVVFVCSFLFAIGVAFGFIVLAPFAIKFLSGYSVGIAVENSTSLKSYVGYLTNFTIPTGIIFQMPLLVYFLAKVGLLTDQFMRTYRKHSLVIIFILAAMITPPDPMTMFLIGVPLYGLYERYSEAHS